MGSDADVLLQFLEPAMWGVCGPRKFALPFCVVWCIWYILIYLWFLLFFWTCEFRGLQRGTGIALCGAYTAKSLLGSSGQKKIICMIFLFLLFIFKLMDITEREHLKLLAVRSA